MSTRLQRPCSLLYTLAVPPAAVDTDRFSHAHAPPPRMSTVADRLDT
ncbi:MAG: hypothetical protein J07HB67_02271, partial [halophilic archaeon J07HB67]